MIYRGEVGSSKLTPLCKVCFGRPCTPDSPGSARSSDCERVDSYCLDSPEDPTKYYCDEFDLPSFLASCTSK